MFVLSKIKNNLIKKSHYKKFISLMLSFLMLLTNVIYFPQNLQQATAEEALYWDNTGVSAITFAPNSSSGLTKTFPSTPSFPIKSNIVTFKTFAAENGTGAGFSLLQKYKDINGNFDPSAYTIMIEDAYDLYNWSNKCYYKDTVLRVNTSTESAVYLKASYILGNNINYTAQVLSGIIPIGMLGVNDAAARFTGTFDGQGFEISNLKLTADVNVFSDSSGDACLYYAMFANIGAGGIVKNLGLRSPYYTNPSTSGTNLNIAGLMGTNRGSVTYCFVVQGSAKHETGASSTASQVSGLMHTNTSTGTLGNCYFAGDILNTANAPTTTYSPIVFRNDSGGTITSTYFDSSIISSPVTSNSNASGPTVTLTGFFTGTVNTVIKTKITALVAGKVTSLEYSIDGGTNWLSATPDASNPIKFTIGTTGFVVSIATTVNNAVNDIVTFTASVINADASVVAKITSQLQNRTSILQDDQWYTDNYSFSVSAYVAGYPRLQGFKYNNSLANSTTNPYYLERPADLIFFSNALTAYAAFGSSTARFFRLKNCLDMSVVSASAYTTPTNDFYGNFEGTIDDASKPCVASHVGVAEQLSNHCIINLRLTKTVTKTISSTTHILLGLVCNTNTSTANFPTFKNINYVGGYVTLPALSQSDAYNAYCDVGTFISYSYYAKFYNVHNSADVSSVGNGDYICRLCIGGLAGNIGAFANTQKCSNSGAITAGTYIYNSSLSSLNSGVGGLFGVQDSGGSTTTQSRQLSECVNFGTITGMSITSNLSTGLFGICHVGGIGGYITSTTYTIDKVINYGTINSLKKLDAGATVFPINRYYTAGLYGTGPVGQNSTNETKMCNNGTIYVNRTDNTTVGGVFAAGIAGNTSSTANVYKNVGNAGNIVLAKDIKNIYAAGLTMGSVSLTNCYNDGNITVEDNLTLTLTYEFRLYGLSGGGSQTITTSYNKKDINISFLNTTVTTRVAGISYSMNLNSCENYGKINISTSGQTGTVYVAGVADASGTATSCVNNVNATITVSAFDQTSDLWVAGVICNNNTNGTATSCINNANISVTRSNQTSVGTRNTYIAGVKGGRSTNSTDSLTDCENNGAIYFDSYFVAGATTNSMNSLLRAYIAGIGIFANAINRCVNNGDIVIAKNYDYTGVDIYVAGILYNAYYNSNTNVLQNCRNFGRIYNQNNITTSVNSTGRNIIFNGIAHYAPPNMSGCVNLGDITMTSNNTPSTNTTNMFINGVAHYTGPIDSNRSTYGVTGLANVGALKIDQSGANLPGSYYLTISGVISQPGTGNSLYAGTLPFDNLVNSGKITLNARTASATTYNSPGNNGFTATNGNINVGGISAMAGINTNGSLTTSIPLKNSANTGDINVDLIGSNTTTSSKTIIYNVGGIVANSAPSSYSGTTAVSKSNTNSGTGSLTGSLNSLPNNAVTTNFRIKITAVDGTGLVTAMDYSIDGGTTWNTAAPDASTPRKFTISGYSKTFSVLTIINNVVGDYYTFTDSFSNERLNIIDCVNSGNITVLADNSTSTSSSNGRSGVGGILGYAFQDTNIQTTATNENNINSAVYNCVNFGNITGGFSTGGIVGVDGAVIKNVINFGVISGAQNASVGGILGAVRATNKTNPKRQQLTIDGAINYGTVVDASGATALYKGGIIGNIDIAQDASIGIRRYANIINTANVPFVKNTTTLQSSAATTFGTGTLIDIYTETFNTNFFINSGNYPIYKTVGADTDVNSIYYKDTNNDANSFFWRQGEDQPQNNNIFVYMLPDKSARNYDPLTQARLQTDLYPNGIYAMSASSGKTSGYYPGSNIQLQNCDPVLISGSGYTNWRTDVIGTNTMSVETAMRYAGQVILSTEADILALQITSGGGTPTLLKNASIDTETSTVKFYVIQDNFTAATYTPDMYSVNTVVSSKASFTGSVAIDLSSITSFTQSQTLTFPLTVRAESGRTKQWTIEINTVVAQPPLTLTQIKEGVNIENNSTVYSTHQYTQNDTYNFTLDGDVSSVHNNTLIFNFNTVGLLPNKDMIGDISLQKSDGTPVTAGASSSGIGSNNTTYYNVIPPASFGVNSYNNKVISSDYTTYLGTLTAHIRLHSNLNSGNYRVKINTSYGAYYFYFTKELSSEAEIQVAPQVVLLSATNVACSIDSANAQINNTLSLTTTPMGIVPYGNAPDISKISQTPQLNGMFSATPTISKNATISSQTLISVTDNGGGSKIYLFGFTITAQNGTVKNWKIRIVTQAYNTNPVNLEADYNGTTYVGTGAQDASGDIFVMSKTQSGTFTVRYDATSGNSGNNRLYNILNIDYCKFDIYMNNTLIPTSSYTDYGLTVPAKPTLQGNYLVLTISATKNLPAGNYEVRMRYYKSLATINPAVQDSNAITYDKIEWNDTISYPTFYFYKSFGKKFSYATGLTVPVVPDIYSITCDGVNIPWTNLTTFDYSTLGGGIDITTEENANRNTHRLFNIVLKYKIDTFYYNFTPMFNLPDGATLKRETFPGAWEDVTADNLAADFSSGLAIKYRVYAEDTRYYQDYAIKLLTVAKNKQFNISFVFQNGAINTLPVSATLKSISQDTNNNYTIFGNTTIFSHPTQVFTTDKVPAGTYVFNVMVPQGYRYNIVADNSPTPNDILINNKLIAGNSKMKTMETDDPQNFNITVYIEPIQNYSTPWGIFRKSRG